MASYRLRSEEVSVILTAADDPLYWVTRYRDWVPIETIPEAKLAKTYILTKFAEPKSSFDGVDAEGVATARTEDSVNLTWYRYKFAFHRTEVASARRAGVPLQTENIRMAMRNMHLRIARLIYQGSMAWDAVSINGMIDDGEDVDAGLDDNAWNTAGEPVNHMLEGFSDIIDNTVPGPYTVIISSNLLPGFATKHNAAVDLSSAEYCRKAFQISNIYYEAHGAADEDGLTIYPLPAAAADDGVWIMCAPKPSNFVLFEVFPPTIHMNPVLNRDTQSFHGYIEWLGAFHVKQVGSIVYEPDVDLVA